MGFTFCYLDWAVDLTASLLYNGHLGRLLRVNASMSRSVDESRLSVVTSMPRLQTNERRAAASESDVDEPPAYQAIQAASQHCHRRNEHICNYIIAAVHLQSPFSPSRSGARLFDNTSSYAAAAQVSTTSPLMSVSHSDRIECWRHLERDADAQ